MGVSVSIVLGLKGTSRQKNSFSDLMSQNCFRNFKMSIYRLHTKLSECTIREIIIREIHTFTLFLLCNS